MSNRIPLVVEFAPGSKILRHEAPESEETRPAWEQREPDAFVVLKGGKRVPVPGDQIVLGEDGEGRARLGFGGMSFEGLEGGSLIFWRVRDLPERDPLESASGDDKLILDSRVVTRVEVEGRQVWPR